MAEPARPTMIPAPTPPPVRQTAAPEPEAPAPPKPEAAEPEPEAPAPEPEAPAPEPEAPAPEPEARPTLAAVPSPEPEPETGAPGPRPALTVVGTLPAERRALEDASVDAYPEVGQPQEGGPADSSFGKPPSSRRSRWRWVAALVLVAAALAIVFTAFRAGDKTNSAASSTRTSTPVKTTTAAGAGKAGGSTTTGPPVTAAPATPSSPQPSADAAANALISSWAQGSQAKALTFATPEAVVTLFGSNYQSGLAIDRGCNNGPSPETCSFGPPGGSSPTDPLYSLTVTQAPGGGWYVSAVQVLS